MKLVADNLLLLGYFGLFRDSSGEGAKSLSSVPGNGVSKKAGLSETVEVGGAFARVGGESDYFLTKVLSGRCYIMKKVVGANALSRWRNRPTYGQPC